MFDEDQNDIVEPLISDHIQPLGITNLVNREFFPYEIIT